MMQLVDPGKSVEENMHVMLIGNNPIELGEVENKLKNLSTRGVNTETAFDLKSLLQRMVSFRPGCIVIDDNVGKYELSSLVNNLSHNKLTKDVPIVVLKNSNYAESLSNGVAEYILKASLTAESLYKAMINAFRYRKTTQYLYQTLRRQKINFKRRLRSI